MNMRDVAYLLWLTSSDKNKHGLYKSKSWLKEKFSQVFTRTRNVYKTKSPPPPYGRGLDTNLANPRDGKNQEDLIGSEMDLLCEPVSRRTYCILGPACFTQWTAKK